LILNKFFNFT
ncbi:unnamed protein product, partial [Allacma fusca]